MQEIIKKFRISNILFFLIKIVSFIIPIFSLGISTRILNPYDYGNISYLQNTLSYFLILAPFGLNIYAITKLGKNFEKTKELTSQIFSTNFLTTTISVLAYLLMGFFFDKTKLSFYLIFSLILTSNLINVEWLNYHMKKHLILSIILLFSKVIYLLNLLLFPYFYEYIYYYILLFVLVEFLPKLLNFLFMNYTFNFKFDFSKTLSLLKESMPFFINILFVELYSLFDITVLNFFLPYQDIGFYSLSLKIIRYIIILLSVFSPLLLSKFSNNRSLSSLSSDIVSIQNVYFFLTIGIISGLFVLQESIFFIFFDDLYLDSLDYFRLLIILIFPITLNSYISRDIFYSIGLEKKKFFVSLFASIINFVLLIVLVPILKVYGAVFSVIFTEYFVLLLSIYFLRIKLRFYKFFSLPLLASLLSAVVLNFILEFLKVRFFYIINLQNLIVLSLVGFSLYLLLFIIINKILGKTFKK
jgi:O-antigen/teichoic acid export membrane protein